MLIPICTEKDSSLALSIVESKEGCSVMPCSIVNGYSMAPLPSHMLDKDEFTTETGATVEPIVYHDHTDMIVEGNNLKDCINKVMKSLGSDHENIIPINTLKENSLVILMDANEETCLFTLAHVVDTDKWEKTVSFNALKRSEEMHIGFFFIDEITVLNENFYDGLYEMLLKIKEKFN